MGLWQALIAVLIALNQMTSADELEIPKQQDTPDVSPDPFIFRSPRLPGYDGEGNWDTRPAPSVANGHLAHVVTGDTVYMNGVYTGYLGWSYRARIPAVHSLRFQVPRDAEHDFALHIRKGVYEETVEVDEADLVLRTYAHQYYNRLLVTDITMTRERGHAGNLIVGVRRLSGDDSDDLVLQDAEDYDGSCHGSDPCRIRSGTIVEAETDDSGLTPVHLIWNELPDDFVLPAGVNSQTWTFIFAMDVDEFVARAHFDTAMNLISESGTEELADLHMDQWEAKWEEGYLEVEGPDLDLIKVIYGSFYYLLSNLPSEKTYTANNQFYGLSPGGLATGRNGSDYYGHVFWDMETWMYPPMLIFRSDLAKEMLSYRINGMDPAFDRASLHGHEGTRFPWESGYTGVEVTPDICPKCRENQQHITGDIAFAARQYLSATRDVDFLASSIADLNDYTGFNFFQEMARFWYTRPTWNGTKERYEINGVMAPDEHAEEVNNSIFTNVVAALAVHFGRYAACLAGMNAEEEIPDSWLDVVENLYFPFHPEKRYHEEYELYDWELENNASDPRGVKQADVVLLAFPLMWNMPEDVRRNDLEHYESRTHPAGPAMTWSMHTVGWLDMSELSEAARHFNRSYQTYVLQPFKVWTEAYEGIGAVNFITGQGGFLQALLFGYAGMRLRVESLTFREHVLPEGLTKMAMKNVDYLDSKLDLIFTAHEVEIIPRKISDEFPLVLRLSDSGDEINLEEREDVEFRKQDFEIFTSTPSGCPLPRDSINVDYGF